MLDVDLATLLVHTIHGDVTVLIRRTATPEYSAILRARQEPSSEDTVDPESIWPTPFIHIVYFDCSVAHVQGYECHQSAGYVMSLLMGGFGQLTNFAVI